MRIPAGDASTPGLTFIADPDTGLLRPAANRIQVATGGTARWEVDSSGHLKPVADNTYDIGQSGSEIKDLWIDGLIRGGSKVATAGTWTPNLIALTTNPTLGSGSSSTGYYMQIGEHVSAWMSIIWGTSGTSAGSGQYRVDNLPVTSKTAAHPLRSTVGEGRILCAGTGDSIVTSIVSGTTVNFLVSRTGTVITHAVPGAWTVNDEIHAHFEYLAA